MSEGAPPETTALFVARAWVQGDPPRVAARVTFTPDVAGPERVSVVARDAGEIADALRRWLGDLSPTGGDGEVTAA